MVNEERTAAGLNALTMDDSLSAAACVRAREIVTSFSHTRPDGSSFSTVASGAYGENIKNLTDTWSLISSWQSVKDTTIGIFGEDGLGWGMLGNIGDTANEVFDGSWVVQQYRDWFNGAVKDLYTTGTQGGN